jgi:hypothetical protein
MPFQKAVGRAIGFAIIAFCCVAGHAQDTRYVEYGFSFQPPPGWQEDRAAGGDVRVQYLGPQRNDRIQARLNLTTQNYAVDLNDRQINSMADEMIANLKSLGMKDPQVIDRRKIPIAGIDALQMDMTYDQDRIPMRLRQVYVPVADHKRTYLFTFVDKAERFDETAPAAAAAINSFSPATSRASVTGADTSERSDAGLPGWVRISILIFIASVALFVVIWAAYLLMRKR